MPTDDDGQTDEDRANDCPTCDGEGKIKAGTTDCPDCAGTGVESKSANTPGRKPRARRSIGREAEFRTLRTDSLEVRSGAGADATLVEVKGQVVVYDQPYEVYDMWGSFTETIRYGACAAALAADTLDVRFLLNHNSDMPLARTGAVASLTLEDSPEGLNVTALIDPRQSAANDLIVALENKTITQMSIGMIVEENGDVWSGEDDYGMPNVRDIFRLSDILDTSAVTYPASPTTSIALARKAWEAVPTESRERTRNLWAIAKEGRTGRLSQHDSDILLHALEELHSVDTADVPDEDRAAPTAQDTVIANKIVALHAAAAAVLAAQVKDPDNNSDPVDKKVMALIQQVLDDVSQLSAAQAKDGTPDAPEAKAANDVVQPDADGTNTSGGNQAPGLGSDDGTGSRSAVINIDLDLARLRRKPAA